MPLIYLLVFVSTCAFPSFARTANLTKSELKQIFGDLSARRLMLAPTATRALTAYVRTQDGDALYVKSRSILFRYPYSVEVKIERLAGVQRSVYQHLRTHEQPGRGRIDIYPPHGRALTLNSLREVLSEIFLPDSVGASSPLIGNRQSHMAHVREANHLPPHGDRFPLESPQAAEVAGYQLCPICFRLLPPVSGYALEERLGEYVAAQYRIYHPVVYDDSLTPRLERVGRRVLENWFLPLRGYNYRFYVSDDEDPNAIACPGGWVFVARGLLRAVESDAELEALLAHEIAHVERRHGYLQYRSAERNFWPAILLGGVVGKSTGSTDAAAIAASVVRAAGAIALSGYSRAHEEEADSYSLTYLVLRSPTHSVAPLLAVFKKLQYFDTASGDLQGGPTLLSTHPGIFERIDRVERAQVDTFSSAARFTGYDKDGQPLLLVALETQVFTRFAREWEGQFDPSVGRRGWSITDKGTEPFRSRKPGTRSELQLFATVESTLNLSNSISIGDLCLGSRCLSNSGTTEIGPLESVGANFRIANAQGLLSGEIGAFELNAPGVTRWEKVEDW